MKTSDVRIDKNGKKDAFKNKLTNLVLRPAVLLLVLVAVGSALIVSAEVLQSTKLTASDGAAGDEFGVSVSISRDTLVVGADEADADSTNSGAAYVYVRDGESWIQQAKLTASDGAADNFFGFSVSISRDTIVAGSDSNADKGAAYVFVRDEESWIQQAKLTASDGAAGDRFGESVSIDRDTVVVGSLKADGVSNNSGAAYVFERDGDSWIQQAKLTASDGAANDGFGRFVSINRDTVVVGSDRNDSKGAAYVFVRDGESWIQQAKLTASDGAAGDRFGRPVSINRDTVVVGAFNHDDNGANSGAAYVFVRDEESWIQQAKLTASDVAVGDRFGGSVSINRDTAVVGAFTFADTSPNSGSAHVFELKEEYVQ